MEADTVFVDTESAVSGPEILLRVYAKAYLEATIKGRANVLYLGYPHIRKQEFHQGRLIDGNRYK